MEALNSNRSEEAVKYFTACINKNPRDVKVLLARSKAFLENYNRHHLDYNYLDSALQDINEAKQNLLKGHALLFVDGFESIISFNVVNSF